VAFLTAALGAVQAAQSLQGSGGLGGAAPAPPAPITSAVGPITVGGLNVGDSALPPYARARGGLPGFAGSALPINRSNAFLLLSASALVVALGVSVFKRTRK